MALLDKYLIQSTWWPAAMNDLDPVRVKLFLLSEESVWTDVGVGFIHFLPDEASIVIESEHANSDVSGELVRLDLREVTCHSIENDSILMLEFPEDSYAISFKEEGAQTIHKIYHHIHVEHLRKLMPKHNNLDSITFEVRTALKQLVKNPKTIVTMATSMPEYLHSLRTLFEEIEEEADQDLQLSQLQLGRIFDIVKRLINEPDQDLISILISDDILPLTLGALEYNPLTPYRRNFRKEILELRYVNLIDLPENVVKNCIIPNMRLHFLRDCVVATFIEPLTQIKFTNICQKNSTQVLAVMNDDPAYFTRLIERFYDDVGVTVGFLEELCNTLKNLSKYALKVMVEFQLMKVNIYDVLHMCMEEIHPRGSQGGSMLVEKILDIMGTLTMIDNEFLEQYVLENNRKCEFYKNSTDKNNETGETQPPLQCHFLSYLIEIFATDSASSKGNVVSVVTNLLNPESSTKAKSLQLLNVIQEKFLKACALRIILGENTVHPNESLRLFCEFLSTIFQWYPTRVRRVIIQTSLINHLNTKNSDKKVLLASIRLLKVLVESKDIHTYRYLMSNDLFKELEVAYRNNKHKSNLVESAFRNFFDCVTFDMPKKLIGYLNTTFNMVLVSQERSTVPIVSLKDIR